MGAEILLRLDSYPSSTLDSDLMLWFKSVLSHQPGLAREAPHTTSPIPVFCQWPQWTVNGGRPPKNVGLDLRWTGTQTSTFKDTHERRSNLIQWHRSCLGVRLTALSPPWPRSSFLLSTFFQAFGRDLFSFLSALFKDLLYAGSPPDAVLKSPHCLSFFPSPSFSFCPHISTQPASSLSVATPRTMPPTSPL